MGSEMCIRDSCISCISCILGGVLWSPSAGLEPLLGGDGNPLGRVSEPYRKGMGLGLRVCDSSREGFRTLYRGLGLVLRVCGSLGRVSKPYRKGWHSISLPRGFSAPLQRVSIRARTGPHTQDRVSIPSRTGPHTPGINIRYRRYVRSISSRTGPHTRIFFTVYRVIILKLLLVVI